MLVHIVNCKIYIIKQDIRSNGLECIRYGIVASLSYPEISRRSNGTIDSVYIQGDELFRDDFPLVARDNNELCYIISNLKAFCKHFDEQFEIVDGRIKLNDC